MDELDRETTLLHAQLWGLFKTLPANLRSSCVDHFAEFRDKDGRPSYAKATGTYSTKWHCVVKKPVRRDPSKP